MERVFITGSDGMLGSDIVRQLRKRKEYQLVCSTIADMDITDLHAVMNALARSRPDVLIHTAGYTGVDRAQREQELCFAINAEGTKNLAFFCRELDIQMIYISTDYVFDGKKKKPYVETDPPHPINAYGTSKLKGEEHVQTLLTNYKIIRTSWLTGLHGLHGKNFVETILSTASRKSRLSVVNDQIGKPTFTFHLAQQIELMLSVNASGIFHITNDGICSWYEFSRRIIDLSQLRNVTIKPITSKGFRSLAKRPANSTLENARLQELKIPLLPHWEEGLKEYLRRRKLKAASSVSEGS
jgi:dTDP-4-dehydrorhamnose reductase